MNIYYITYIFELNYKSIIDAHCIYLVQFLLPSHSLTKKKEVHRFTYNPDSMFANK